jgi:hypothetical protein
LFFSRKNTRAGKFQSAASAMVATCEQRGADVATRKLIELSNEMTAGSLVILLKNTAWFGSFT